MAQSHRYDLNRVEFYSTDNLANGMHLSKAEPILKNEIKSAYEDINDVMELYNIKQYIDAEVYLKIWTQDDIEIFKQKVSEYGKIIGQFMSKLNDSNVADYYDVLLQGYISSFWELVNNQKIFKNISADNFKTILLNAPRDIHTILHFKNVVFHYKTFLRDFLMDYPKSAEILLSIYEKKNDFHNKEMFLPDTLTIKDKEDIISQYLDAENANLNYIQLIQNVRDNTNFKISPKTRLKAKRRGIEETERFFKEQKNSSFKYGVSISFIENQKDIKHGSIENFITNYTYSLDYIKQNNGNYSLFQNFNILFEYLDEQDRINLVSKTNQMGVFEQIMGFYSQNEYRGGIAFRRSEITSHAQIVAYNKIINNLGNSLESVLQNIFTSEFQSEYNFAAARLTMPSDNITFLEKLRVLLPEFESVLKQYKLFVEDGSIDFDLLQMSSQPCTIKEIPSLLQNKYIYLNEENKEIIGVSNLFFSDQTLLAYVEPCKEKHYNTFFNLLANEQVNFNNYEEHQKPKLNDLIDKGFIFLDENNFICVTNLFRVLILKDLYDNEVASFYHYPVAFQDEVKQMVAQEVIYFESSLFSKPEQSYFNYFLNKSEFTNGLDLRNSYLHGTQANPEEIQKHEYAYFTYLKLLVLALLKIEDDLFISNQIRN
jgi:hypothetical protein